MRSDVTWWRRICDKFLTLSNQTSLYIRECIRIHISQWRQMLWVFIGIASLRQLQWVPTTYSLMEKTENINIVLLKTSKQKPKKRLSIAIFKIKENAANKELTVQKLSFPSKSNPSNEQFPPIIAIGWLIPPRFPITIEFDPSGV